MKSMEEILAEMGFHKNASQATKEAFIKHLIKASTGVEVKTPTEKHVERLINQQPPTPQTETPAVVAGAQLEFDFGKKTG